MPVIKSNKKLIILPNILNLLIEKPNKVKANTIQKTINGSFIPAFSCGLPLNNVTVSVLTFCLFTVASLIPILK